MSLTVCFRKERYQINLEGLTSVQAVKGALCVASGIPVQYQRLLVSGKELKDDTKSLGEVGVKEGMKIMLLTTQNYVPPAKAAETTKVSEPTEAPGPPARTKQIIDTAIPGILQEEPGLVVVRHGWTHYKVKVHFELTFGDLRAHLAMLTEVPPAQMRLLAKGKERADDVVLKDLGKNSLTVMLFFREGYHRVQDALEWLRSSEAELEEIERKTNGALNRVQHRLQDPVEISFLVRHASEFMEECRTSLESLATTAEWDAFRDRLKALEQVVDQLRAVKL